MERCTLHVFVPPSNERHATHIPSRPISVEMSLLAVSTPIDTKVLQSRISIRETTPLGSFHLTHGTQWEWRFDCPMDTLYSFLLDSRTLSGSASWWQDGQDGEFGTFVHHICIQEVN